MDNLSPEDTGHVFAWDGEPIDYQANHPLLPIDTDVHTPEISALWRNGNLPQINH